MASLVPQHFFFFAVVAAAKAANAHQFIKVRRTGRGNFQFVQFIYNTKTSTVCCIQCTMISHALGLILEPVFVQNGGLGNFFFVENFP